MSKQSLLWTLACLLGAATLAVLAFGLRDDSLQRIRSAQVIRIGYAVEAPYAFIDARGQVSGESPEMAKRIVRRLGIARIEWVRAPFGELIAGLNAGKFDVIAAGMFVTQERAQLVSFSRPTLQVSPALLVPKGNPKSINALNVFLNRPDLRVAVLQGSVEMRRMQQMGVAADAMLVVPDMRAGQIAVGNGMADALALSQPTLRWAARSEPKAFEVVAGELRSQPDYVAFAFRRQDKALRKAWDKQAQGWIGSPQHLEIIKPFGFTLADISGLPNSVSFDRIE